METDAAVAPPATASPSPRSPLCSMRGDSSARPRVPLGAAPSAAPNSAVVALIGGAGRRTGSAQWERRTTSGSATGEEDSIRWRRLVDEACRPLPVGRCTNPNARFPPRTGLNMAAARPVEDRPWSEQPLLEPCKQRRRWELEGWEGWRKDGGGRPERLLIRARLRRQWRALLHGSLFHCGSYGLALPLISLSVTACLSAELQWAPGHGRSGRSGDVGGRARLRSGDGGQAAAPDVGGAEERASVAAVGEWQWWTIPLSARHLVPALLLLAHAEVASDRAWRLDAPKPPSSPVPVNLAEPFPSLVSSRQERS